MRRNSPPKIFLLIAFLLLLCFPAYIYATGGAFPYTKHGGGTTDGLTPCAGGVNRGLGADYGGDCATNPEAGTYKSGECAHCHEPHSSFGEAEPPPSSGADAGPDPYLLMKEYGTATNYANLCWYCHNNIGNINGSGSPSGMGRWSFYQGEGVYGSSSHDDSASFYWPGTTGDPVSIWPRQTRQSLPSGNLGSCLNCHTPHGIRETAGSAFDTGAVPTSPTNRHLAANNLSVSTDYLIPRQLIAWEEGLCENCHDGSPASTNIQAEIDKRSPSPSAAAKSGHPVDDTAFAGSHVASEAIPVTTKHVECYDCHNPHAAKAPTGALNDGDGGRVKGMKFIDISGTLRDPATGFRQPYVYEICLKCHGNTYATFIPDKAWGANTLRTTVLRAGTSCATNINPASGCTDGSNKRLEFDTATNALDGFGGTLAGNRAYHPVAAAGRNTSAALNNQLLGGLTTSSTINCTDCHNTNATTGVQGSVTESNLRATDDTSGYAGASPVGPHGSTNVRILRDNYDTTLGTTSASAFANWDSTRFQLCFNCHNVSAFTDPDGIVGVQMTNFRQDAIGCVSSKVNLHALHLTDVATMGWNFETMYTSCANCHYNVHSNAEATNTQYGTATGGTGVPADGDTHLVNFSPIVEPLDYTKPRWWDAGWYASVARNVMRCNLKCHDARMGNFQGGFPATIDAWYVRYGS